MLKTTAADRPPSLAAPVFEKFRRLAYEKFGLNLTDAKQELVAARLGKKLRELQVPTFEAYYDLVMADRTGDSLVALIDAPELARRFHAEVRALVPEVEPLPDPARPDPAPAEPLTLF